MENTAIAFINAMGDLGAGYLFAIGIVCIIAFVAIKSLPMVDNWQQQRIGIEIKREERKCQEELSREQRDRERSEMEGRWLNQYESATRVQEQTNIVMEGVREQMHVLNATLDDSKRRSGEMAHKVDEIHSKVC